MTNKLNFKISFKNNNIILILFKKNYKIQSKINKLKINRYKNQILKFNNKKKKFKNCNNN